MSDSKFQISKRLTDGTILLIGGDNATEFAANLEAIIGETGRDFVRSQFYTLIEETPTVTPQQGYANAQTIAQPAPAAAHPANAPVCPHGTRVWKEGVSKAGKNYKMWACPSSDRATQCEPSWVR